MDSASRQYHINGEISQITTNESLIKRVPSPLTMNETPGNRGLSLIVLFS